MSARTHEEWSCGEYLGETDWEIFRVRDQAHVANAGSEALAREIVADHNAAPDLLAALESALVPLRQHVGGAVVGQVIAAIDGAKRKTKVACLICGGTGIEQTAATGAGERACRNGCKEVA